jgi:hypothetical protein
MTASGIEPATFRLLAYLCKFHPRTGHEGPEGELRYSSTFSLIPALDGGGWSTPRPGRFIPWNYPVPIVQEAGWAPGPVWTGAENLAPTGIFYIRVRKPQPVATYQGTFPIYNK